MRIFTFIFLGYLIINVLSTEILRKDGSVKTRDGYIIFDSSEFLIGDTMYFEIESSSIVLIIYIINIMMILIILILVIRIFIKCIL